MRACYDHVIASNRVRSQLFRYSAVGVSVGRLIWLERDMKVLVHDEICRNVPTNGNVLRQAPLECMVRHEHVMHEVTCGDGEVQLRLWVTRNASTDRTRLDNG